MKRILVGAVVAAALFVGLVPTAWASAPAVHDEFLVAGDVFVCEGAAYTITGGTVKFVEHFTEAAMGTRS
jgi:hypothetical protein